MSTSVCNLAPFDQARVAPRAAEIFSLRMRSVHERTDRMFAGLLAAEFAVGNLMAVLVSPLTWAGESSRVHVHVWSALIVGGLIVSLPIVLALRHPGERLTRHCIAIAQMLMSALFIHLSGGRIETHFHVFGSLAF